MPRDGRQQRISEHTAYPVGAALAAKNPTRCMAPAAPVFAAKAACVFKVS
ncbi:hypothetical protein RK21_01571 [Pseudomonas plecoglossicida]|nr:hypothetical protein RK21_01571 [Pseudomonas plecoglossicida]